MVPDFLCRAVLRVFCLVLLALTPFSVAAATRDSNVSIPDVPTPAIGDLVVVEAEIDNPFEAFFIVDWSAVGATLEGDFKFNQTGFYVTPDMAGRTVSVTAKVVFFFGEHDEDRVIRTATVLIAIPGGPVGGQPEAPVLSLHQSRINNVMTEAPDLAAVFDGDLGNGPGITVSSMGGAASVATGMGGPIWAELRGNRSVLAGARGSYVLGSAGVHWTLGEGVVLGMMAIADRSTLEVAGAPVKGVGWMVGPYGVMRMDGTPLVLQARYLVGDSRNRLADGSVFGSRRSLAMLELSGMVAHGGVEFMPSLRAARGSETSDAFTNAAGTVLPAQRTALSQVETGIAVAFPVDLGSGSTRARLSLSDLWTDGAGSGLDGHRGKVSLMLRHRFAARGELTISLGRDGLGMASYKATDMGLNYALQF